VAGGGAYVPRVGELEQGRDIACRAPSMYVVTSPVLELFRTWTCNIMPQTYAAHTYAVTPVDADIANVPPADVWHEHVDVNVMCAMNVQAAGP
jgi:hypothetical protein